MYIRVEDIPEETLALVNLDVFIDYIEIKNLLRRIEKEVVKLEDTIDKLRDELYQLQKDDSDILYEMEVGK